MAFGRGNNTEGDVKLNFQIKHRFSGNLLFEAECGSLRICVEMAIKSGADLSSANLSSADLRSADLSSADLRSADLRSADLSSADGVNKYLVTPLLVLLDQPGKIRAYKLTDKDGKGPYYPSITYIVGHDCAVQAANTDEAVQCAEGISLATLDWCLKEYRPGYRILVAEFEASDIAAIPTGSDGKFRVHRCKIVAEKDLVELGIQEQPE